MKVTLKVTQGKPIGMEIELKSQFFSIGRDAKCNLRPNSDLISKVHCQITKQDQIVFVNDPGSTNGTFVNGVRINPNRNVEIKDRDTLKVGPLEFTVTITGIEPVVPKPAPGEEDDAMSWLMGENEGVIAEPNEGSTITEIPKALLERSEIEETVASSKDPTDPNVPMPERNTPAAPQKKDTRDAASDILSKYFDRRRPTR